MIDFALLISKFSAGTVAQSVEQRTENPRVGGSIPSRPTTFCLVKTPKNFRFKSERVTSTQSIINPA